MIERVNPAFEELTGYSSVEAVGQDLSWIAADGPMSDTYRRIWVDQTSKFCLSPGTQMKRSSERVFQTSLATFCRSLFFCDRWPERSAKSSTELPWRTPPVQRDLDSPLALV
jgi:hypothetical protein